jgi:hypothetical protein
MRRSWGESDELSLSCGLRGLPFFGEDGEPVVADEDCTAEGSPGNSLPSGSEVCALVAGGCDDEDVAEESFAESALVQASPSSSMAKITLRTSDQHKFIRPKLG